VGKEVADDDGVGPARACGADSRRGHGEHGAEAQLDVVVEGLALQPLVEGARLDAAAHHIEEGQGERSGQPGGAGARDGDLEHQSNVGGSQCGVGGSV